MSRALPDKARRGWCPGLTRPMPTGDGLLARIHPPLGVLTLAQARAVAEGALRYGNGHLDLTARANLQIRGVSEATTAPLATLLDEVGLGDTRKDGGPQRLTLTGPLAELDASTTVDVPALARAIEAAGRDVPGLPAKTLVAVGMWWDEADLSVVPIPEDHVVILPAAEAVAAVECPISKAPEHVAATLGIFARTGRRRLREVTDEEWAVDTSSFEGSPKRDALSSPLRGGVGGGGGVGCGSALPPELPPPLPLPKRGRESALIPFPGLTTRGAHTILALDAPFGRCTVEAFERLIAVAEDIGAPEFRLSPSRGIVLIPSRPERVAAHLTKLQAEFITGADDPRRAVSACTGAPACASGTTPTLRDAARLAEVFRPYAARGLSAHVSGCAKGCARPGPADLTLVGDEGTYGIVLGGSPSDPPTQQLPIEAALERLGRAATVGLAAAFAPAATDGGRNRRPA